MEDADDTKSLLQAFPFLFDDESPCLEQPRLEQPHLEQPLAANHNDIDVFVDLPIDYEHGSFHVNDEDDFNTALLTSDDPLTYQDAISSPQKDQWKEGMEAEYDSLLSKGTWILTKLPPSRTTIKNANGCTRQKSKLMVLLISSKPVWLPKAILKLQVLIIKKPSLQLCVLQLFVFCWFLLSNMTWRLIKWM